MFGKKTQAEKKTSLSYVSCLIDVCATKNTRTAIQGLTVLANWERLFGDLVSCSNMFQVLYTRYLKDLKP